MDFNHQYGQGYYTDTGEEYDGDTCYIDGIECTAFEDRWGGNFIYVASILMPAARAVEIRNESALAWRDFIFWRTVWSMLLIAALFVILVGILRLV